MAKELPRIPIEGSKRLALSAFTQEFCRALDESCEDFMCRMQLYSAGDEICMKAIVFNEDGKPLTILFQMNKDERVLRASKKFNTAGNRSVALWKLGNAIIKYITNLNTLSTRVSNVFFDNGSRFRSVTYSHDTKEKGSICLYLPVYKKDYCGLTDMRDDVGSELADLC